MSSDIHSYDSTSHLLGFEKQGHVALITIHNPPANTWTLENLRALRDLIDQLNQDKEVYSLVLTGQGEKFFSAGADLKLFADGNKEVARQMAETFGEAFEALTHFRGVSIAAVNGYAFGGGLEAALACDLRVAEEEAQFALPEAKVGLLPCAGGTQNLAWLTGEGWAKRMILLGERVNASTALRIGLVEEIVKKGEAKSRAIALANEVANQSPVSITHCKKLIQSARNAPLASGLPDERTRFLQLFDTQDQKEGVNAFLEKRKPTWKNA
jgi:enoyl-CoA hydratase/carnithine racemase